MMAGWNLGSAAGRLPPRDMYVGLVFGWLVNKLQLLHHFLLLIVGFFNTTKHAVLA